MTTICIVGNAPLDSDVSDKVDAADIVIRFNEPAGWGQKSGRKFDVWVIANGNGGRRFAKREVFLEKPYRDVPREIWFPRDPAIHRLLNREEENRFKTFGEKDFGAEIIRRNSLRQTPVYISHPVHHHCMDMLRTLKTGDNPVRIPSSGFLAIEQTRRVHPAARIALIGFTFAGAEVHDWDSERRYVSNLAQSGAVTFLNG